MGAQRVWSQAPTPGPPGQQLHRVEVAPSSWGRWGVGAQHGSMPGAVMAAFPWWSLLPPLPVACAHLGVSTKPQGGEEQTDWEQPRKGVRPAPGIAVRWTPSPRPSPPAWEPPATPPHRPCTPQAAQCP